MPSGDTNNGITLDTSVLNHANEGQFYKVGNDLKAVRNEDISAFLKQFPHAIKASGFKTKDGKYYFVEDKDTADFRKSFPDAVNIQKASKAQKPPNAVPDFPDVQNVPKNVTINTPNKVSRETPKPNPYTPIDSYYDAFSTLSGIVNRNNQNLLNPELANRLGEQEVMKLFNEKDLGNISHSLDALSEDIKSERNSLPFQGGGTRDFLSPDDKVKYDTDNLMLNRVNEIKKYLLSRKIFTGDPKKSMSEGIEYMKYDDPDYYNTWIKYAEQPSHEQSPLEQRLDNILKNSNIPEVSQKYRNDQLFNNLKTKLLPKVKYNIEKTALNQNINLGLEKLATYNSVIDTAHADMVNSGGLSKGVVAGSIGQSDSGKQIENLVSNIKDNQKLLSTIDQRYPEVVKQENKINTWQKKYDEWNGGHKFLYNIGAGLANGSLELGAGISHTVGDVFGERKDKSPDELKREQIDEQESKFLSGIDVPNHAGYKRNPDGSVKIGADGNPVTGSGVYDVTYNLADMIPGLAFYAATDAAGEALLAPKLAGTLDEALDAEKVFQAEHAAAFGKKLGLATAVTLQNYGNAYDQAIESGRTKTQAAGIASANVLMQYGIFSMGTPFDKLGEKLSGKEFINKVIDKAGQDKVFSELDNPATYHLGIRTIQKIGYNFLKQTAKGGLQGGLLDLSGKVTQQMMHPEEQVFSTDGFDMKHFWQEMRGNLISMALLSGVSSLVGDVANHKSIRNAIYGDGLYEAATNYSHYWPMLDKMLSDGKITNDQYDRMKATIYKAKDVFDNIPKEDVNGRPLKQKNLKNIFLNALKKEQLIESSKEYGTDEMKKEAGKKIGAVDKAINQEVGIEVPGKVFTSGGIGITEEEASQLPPEKVEIDGKEREVVKEPEPKKEETAKAKPEVKKPGGTFYRHAQTNNNLEGRPNADNTPLNEKGIDQAKELGKRWKQSGIKRVITSKLTRAEQTGNIAAKEAGIENEAISHDQLLNERSRNESPEQFAKRVLLAKNKYQKASRTTAIVSHGEFMKMLKALDEADNDPIKAAELFDKMKGNTFDNTSEYTITNKSLKEGGQNAIPIEKSNESVLRDEGVPREGELPAMGEGNTKDKEPAQKSEKKEEVTPRIEKKKVTRTPSGYQVVYDKDGKIESVLKNGKEITKFNTGKKKNGNDFLKSNPQYEDAIKEAASVTDFDKGERVNESSLSPSMSENDVLRTIAEESGNPKQIAESYKSMSERATPQGEKDPSDILDESGSDDPRLRALQYFANGGKVYDGDMEKMYGDKKGKNIGREKFLKSKMLSDDKEDNMDKLAENMYREYGEDKDGNPKGAYDESDYRNALMNVFNSVKSKSHAKELLNDEVNPERKGLKSAMETASNRFEDMTGIPLNKDVADIISGGKVPETAEHLEEEPPFHVSVSENIKPAKIEFLNKLGETLKRVLPNLNEVRILSGDEFDRAVQDAKEGKFMSSKGVIYGFVSHGDIYLNGDKLNYNTPFHEASHLFTSWSKENAPFLYRSGLDLMDGTRYLKEVKDSKFYRDQADRLPESDRGDFYRDEALARAVGEKGQKLMTSVRTKFVNWLKDFWNSVRSMVGISKPEIESLTADEISKMRIGDFSDMVAKRLKSERELDPEAYKARQNQGDPDPFYAKFANGLYYIGRKYFNPSGLGGRMMRSESERGRGERNKVMERGRQLLRQWDETKKKLSVEELRNLNNEMDYYMTSNDEDAEGTIFMLPDKIRPVAAKMKAFKDKNQDWIIDHGNLIEGKKLMVKNGQIVLTEDGLPVYQLSPKEAFEKVGHTYFGRIYKAYTDKDWSIAKMSPESYNKAYGMMEAQVKQMIPGIENDPEKLRNTVNNEIKAVIAKAYPLKGGLGLFKHREDISDLYRTIWGEIPDAGERFKATFLKQAHIIGTAEFANGLMKHGFNKIFFKSGEEPKNNKVYDVTISDTRLMPLHGLRTTKWINEALESYLNGGDPGVMHWRKWFNNHAVLRDLYGYSLIGKTVYSIGTQINNFFSRGGIAMATGNVSGDVKSSFQAVRDQLTHNEGKSNSLMNEAIERSVINHGLSYGMLLDMFDTAIMDKSKGDLNKKINKIKEWSKVPAKVYGASDDFWNVFNYTSEKTKYAKALFGKKVSALTEDENKQVADIAGELVKMMQPTYGRIPLIIKRLNANPLLANFLSYKAENYRISYNTVAQAIKEIRSDNPAVRRIGFKRMGSFMGYMGVKIAAEKALLYGVSGMVNASIGGVYGFFFDSDEQKRKKAALETFAPFWSKNLDKAYVDEGNGVYNFYNLSREDPYGDLQATVNALTEPDASIGKRAFDMGYNLIGPAFGLSIPAQEIFNVYVGLKSDGEPIYEDYDTPGQKVMKSVEYLGLQMAPTTANSVIDNWNKSYGTRPSNEAHGLVGFSAHRMNVLGTFKSRVYHDAQDLSTIRRKLEKNPDDQSQLDARQRTLDNLRKDYNNAYLLGVSYDDLDEALKKSFIRSEDRYYISGEN